MTHRMQISISESHHSFLVGESERSSVSIAELIRRAIDTTYGSRGGRRVQLITHTLGRRSGVRLADESRFDA
jgi:hypothetical protein